MPGFKDVDVNWAKNFVPGVIQLKLDGTRMTYDGSHLVSDRGCVRDERYPHIAKAIKKFGYPCVGEVAVPGGNVLMVNQKVNWPKAKFYIFGLLRYKGYDTSTMSARGVVDLLENLLEYGDKDSPLDLPKRFDSFDQGWKYVTKHYAEGLVFKDESAMEGYKLKRLTEAKVEVVGYEKGSVKGAFLISLNGVVSKCSALGVGFVEEYHSLIAKGKTVWLEIEYPFLTDSGAPFQPRLRRIGNLSDLS